MCFPAYCLCSPLTLFIFPFFVSGIIHLISSAVLGFGGIYHTLMGPETLEESFPFFGYVWKDKNKITKYDEDIFHIKLSNKAFFEGYFESEKYFIDIKDQILNEFDFINANQYKKILVSFKDFLVIKILSL